MPLRRPFLGSLAATVLIFATVGARGQDGTQAVVGTPGGWQQTSWLSSSPAPADSGKLTATAAPTSADPFAVGTSNTPWEREYGVTYVRPVSSTLSLTCATTSVASDESAQNATNGLPDDLMHGEQAGLQYQLAPSLALGGNLHDSQEDAGSPTTSPETRGGSVSTAVKLPFAATLTFGGTADTTTTGASPGYAVEDHSYDAQLTQPLGKLPLTAVMKGHYEIKTGAGTDSKLPSLEQSLVWKPADQTTVQMGLRQQKYQTFPGVENPLNEAVFADWAQTLLPEVTWHSYAEVLSARDMDVAPAAPTTTGANGTPQSADPTNNLGLPTSLSEEAVTFSTGPSFKLDRDVSASVEYSSRINASPQPGNAGDDQRVSVSLKGSF